MCIGSANAKGTDSGATRLFTAFPWCVLIANVKRTVFKIDLWVRILIVQGRGDRFMVQRHGDFDQSSDSGGCNGVTDVRFDAANGTKLFLVCLCFEHGSQCGHFDWITNWSRCAVSFDVTDGFRFDAGHCLSHGNCGCLTVDARCAKTGFFSAIIVDTEAIDDRVDSISS